MTRPGRLIVSVVVLALTLSACASADDNDAGAAKKHHVATSSTGEPVVKSAECKAPAQPKTVQDLVPSCGALWGIATKNQRTAAIADIESSVGRQFDFVHRFNDINDPIPTAEEKAAANDGRTLYIALDARDYANPNANAVTWRAIADGKYDADLARQARGIAALGAPVFIAFNHEANQSAKTARGTPADFKAAWRHVRAVYTREGATNVAWVWVMIAWPPALARAGAMWPGNDQVDWISWEAYNGAGCNLPSGISEDRYKSFEDGVKGFYDWVHDGGAAYGIDADKPMMISEAGSVPYPGNPQKSADWYRQIPSTLRKYPQIKAIALWDSKVGRCDFRINQSPEVLRAVTDVGENPSLNTR